MNGEKAMNQGDISRYKDLGKLQDLLLLACPAGENGKRSIPVLAKHLGVSNQYVYRWIEDGVVPPKFVRKLVDMSDGRVGLESFHPFVFPSS